MPTPTSHEAPVMSGISPSPILPTGPKVNKQWRCIQCHETFPQSNLLETHAVDTDHKAYRCTKEKACGKLFTLRTSCIRHESSHSAKKSHACSRCGKRFHRMDHCHGHERTCGRVARRAKGPSQSASTSPATTSSGTTETGTPIDLLTTIVDDEDLSHATGTGHKGLLSFDTSGTSHQEDNGHDDDKATPIAFSGLSVPTKPSSTSSAAYFSTVQNGRTASRSAILQHTNARSPPEPGHDTIPNLDNTEDHTTSHSITSQPHAGNDWRDYYQLFQSPYDARSPDLQHTEEDWDFAPGRVPSATTSTPSSQGSNVLPPRRRGITGLINRSSSRHFGARYPTSGFAEQASPVTAQDGGIDNSIFLPGARVTVSDERPIFFGGTGFEHDMNIDTPLSQGQGRGRRRKPPSKMAEFFSKLKAVITAPFRKHKQ